MNTECVWLQISSCLCHFLLIQVPGFTLWSENLLCFVLTPLFFHITMLKTLDTVLFCSFDLKQLLSLHYKGTLSAEVTCKCPGKSASVWHSSIAIITCRTVSLRRWLGRGRQANILSGRLTGLGIRQASKLGLHTRKPLCQKHWSNVRVPILSKHFWNSRLLPWEGFINHFYSGLFETKEIGFHSLFSSNYCSALGTYFSSLLMFWISDRLTAGPGSFLAPGIGFFSSSEVGGAP